LGEGNYQDQEKNKKKVLVTKKKLKEKVRCASHFSSPNFKENQPIDILVCSNKLFPLLLDNTFIMHAFATK
jgi:hypothetical protein